MGGGRGRGNGRGGQRDNSCHYYTSGKTCPYGDSCKYEHSAQAARAYISAHTYEAEMKEAKANIAQATRNPYGYIMSVDSESGDDDTDSGKE